MTAKKPWLTANRMSEADKDRHRQIAKEKGVNGTLERLDQMQRASKPAPGTEPRLIAEQPEPRVIAERPTPRIINDAIEPPLTPDADPQLTELIQLYHRLDPRERLELLYIARIKMHLNQKATK